MLKRSVVFLLGIAAAIMIIPCFAFLGIEPKGNNNAISGEKNDGQVTATTETFQIYNHQTDAVETISAATYIKGVVAAEMPWTYHTEALKAQAVAAHTYALKMKQQESTNPTDGLHGADLSTDPATSQAYFSADEWKAFYGDQYEQSYQKISEAVDAVLNKVILYDGQPIAAVFHAISGGMTEDPADIWGGALPYLKPVLSDGDLLSPDYEGEVVLSVAAVKEKLTAAFDNLDFSGDPKDWIKLKSLTESKSVKEVAVCGKVVSGSDFRSALSLPSHCFTVTYADGNFRFATKGKGHGVGFSQYGADYLARQGKTYDEILCYYYQGVTVANLSVADA